MSVAEKLVDKLYDEYAKYRAENADLPTHFVLSMETRQAVKLMTGNPFNPNLEIKKFLGLPVIHKEKVIIL